MFRFVTTTNHIWSSCSQSS